MTRLSLVQSKIHYSLLTLRTIHFAKLVSKIGLFSYLKFINRLVSSRGTVISKRRPHCTVKRTPGGQKMARSLSSFSS